MWLDDATIVVTCRERSQIWTNLLRDPRVALAYHAREHGFSRSSRYVLVQGVASVGEPDEAFLREVVTPRATRYLGEVPVTSVRFDPTRRKSVDASVIDALTARRTAAR